MKKIHHLILLVIGLATLLGSGGWLWYSRFAEKPLSCIGNVEWNIGSNRFAGTLAFRMYDNAGLATITGKLYGRNTSDISRNIYFNYTRQHEARVLQAMQVVKTFADSADETDINNTLPGFTAKADEPSVWSWKSIRAHGSLPAPMYPRCIAARGNVISGNKNRAPSMEFIFVIIDLRDMGH